MFSFTRSGEGRGRRHAPALYTRERQLPAGRREMGIETRNCVCRANYEYLFIGAYVISRGSRRHELRDRLSARRRRRRRRCVSATTERALFLSLSPYRSSPVLRTASPSVVLKYPVGRAKRSGPKTLAQQSRSDLRLNERGREKERGSPAAQRNKRFVEFPIGPARTPESSSIPGRFS